MASVTKPRDNPRACIPPDKATETKQPPWTSPYPLTPLKSRPRSGMLYEVEFIGGGEFYVCITRLRYSVPCVRLPCPRYWTCLPAGRLPR